MQRIHTHTLGCCRIRDLRRNERILVPFESHGPLTTHELLFTGPAPFSCLRKETRVYFHTRTIKIYKFAIYARIPFVHIYYILLDIEADLVIICVIYIY